MPFSCLSVSSFRVGTGLLTHLGQLDTSISLLQNAPRDSLRRAEERVRRSVADGRSDESRRRAAGRRRPLAGGADTTAGVPRRTRRERDGRADSQSRELSR